jgi:hypothetical protein
MIKGVVHLSFQPTGTSTTRYALGAGSAKRPRSKADDKDSRAGSGVPVFVKERMEERENKKVGVLRFIGFRAPVSKIFNYCG